MAKGLILAVFLGCSTAAWSWPLVDLFKGKSQPRAGESISKSAKSLTLAPSTSISPELEEYPAGKNLEFTIEVGWHGTLEGATVRTPERPSLENLEWVGMTQSQRARPETGGASVAFTMALRPLKEGMARVGPTEIKAISATGEEVSSVFADGIEIVVGAPKRQWGKIVGYAGGGIVIAAILAAIVLGIARAMKKAPATLRMLTAGPSARAPFS